MRLVEFCWIVLDLIRLGCDFRSGTEGSYPDLERFCENRLLEVKPKR